jgi:hypothetical protein
MRLLRQSHAGFGLTDSGNWNTVNGMAGTVPACQPERNSAMAINLTAKDREGNELTFDQLCAMESDELAGLPPETLQKLRDDAILQWTRAAAELATAKKEENSLRLFVVKTCFPTHKEAGTENFELGKGYKLKAVFKVNFKFPDIAKLNAALDTFESKGEAGKLLADRVVKWTPELSLTEYKQLPAEYLEILTPCIETSPGTPSLELVIPDEKKRR